MYDIQIYLLFHQLIKNQHNNDKKHTEIVFDFFIIIN